MLLMSNMRHQQTERQYFQAGSNNSDNNNKNICALKVAEALRVDHTVRYLHTISDLVRAARSKYTVRSRLSAVKKGTSAGQARAKLENISAKEQGPVYGYVIRVNGHVILTDKKGKTMVDTDPRKADRRKITHCYALM